MLSEEQREYFGKAYASPPNTLAGIMLDSKEKEVAIKILNMLHNEGYMVYEATSILDYCKGALLYSPVLKYK